MINKRYIVVIAGTSLLVILGIWLAGSRVGHALTRSRKHFIEHPLDQRILFEPGAEEMATIFASILPVAISRVEDAQIYPFRKTFRVYVCSSQERFNEYLALAGSYYPVRGAVLWGNILIAPSAFNFMGMDTHRETLIHELSHLHFRQRLGRLKERRIPVWFREGYADLVAGSGGEGVTETEAFQMILSGKHFIPEESSGLFRPFQKAQNNLSGPAFHRQAKMFVSFLAEKDTVQFRLLIRDLQDGIPFADSYMRLAGEDIQSSWIQFVDSLLSKDF